MLFRGQNNNLFNLFGACFVPLPNDLDAAAFFSGITQLIIDYINIHQYCRNLIIILTSKHILNFNPPIAIMELPICVQI